MIISQASYRTNGPLVANADCLFSDAAAQVIKRQLNLITSTGYLNIFKL